MFYSVEVMFYSVEVMFYSVEVEVMFYNFDIKRLESISC